MIFFVWSQLVGAPIVGQYNESEFITVMHLTCETITVQFDFSHSHRRQCHGCQFFVGGMRKKYSRASFSTGVHSLSIFPIRAWLHAHVIITRDFCVANVLVGNDSEVAAVDVASTIERGHVLCLMARVVIARTVEQ